MKVATIWSTYGPYHLARVEALEQEFAGCEIVCFSHCSTNESNYPFFNLRPKSHEALVRRDAADLTFRESLFAAARRLFSHKPDLVLACGYERAETLAAVIYARLRGASVFLMLDNQYEDRPRNAGVEWMKGLYLRWFFDGFIYGGDTHRKYLERLGVSGHLCAACYDCVNNAWIEQVSNGFRATGIRHIAAANYFLCVARLIAKKNIPVLLRAYHWYTQHLQNAVEPWHLAICGDGPLRHETEALIADLGLHAGVHLLGREDDFSRVVNYLTFAKALILPSSESEQWGLVVNEAMAAGVPVLVSDKCGCVEALVEDGVNGYKFDPGSYEQLGRLMCWMHEHADELPRMGSASRRIVQSVSPEQFAANVRALYENCGVTNQQSAQTKF